ncbi:hypothetical protein FRC06_004285, partial [Ceratobasidium sp. 370]
DVVRRTGPELANPKRDEMWEFVWTVWGNFWGPPDTSGEDIAVGAVESILADLVEWVAEDVVKEVGDNKRQKVQATIQFKVKCLVRGLVLYIDIAQRKQKRRLQDEGAELSLETFQLNIGKFIQSVPGQTLERQRRIEEAMSHAWDVSRNTYKPLDQAAS